MASPTPASLPRMIGIILRAARDPDGPPRISRPAPGPCRDAWPAKLDPAARPLNPPLSGRDGSILNS